ncbi:MULTISPECIES: hypothetical protein [unclassified Mesorhizobium]|uniref:hypothetical protein n=1 Tax=unclassified Mesorhizobium TaxID=325217 RepID=UPI000FD4C335|nr:MULTISPECIES: hypothetical protein [unclassified Mesorhizobium]RVD15441.1 hypothetical protein EN749_15970 [Mesorhizobium sp. M7A.F.Ca.ET.027.02.1.1]RWD00382.1 MAG: hypothetical protein EOS73_25525 [Mesorhizobium sp.]RWQ18148.1 MAG: hypothetical protein EOR93_18630 [Mesorhizobium sp.]
MKRYARLLVSAATLLLAVGSTGYAADIIDGPTGDYCRVVGTSNLVLNDNIVDLKQEVVKLMDESVAVANSSEWINSSRPVFVWASEAKVACGKAYGYLKTNYKDEDYLNKCECFHDRMVEYMH